MVGDDDPIIWLSSAQAAKLVGVTTRTLYAFIDAGDLVAYKMGRVLRIKKSDALAFIERSRVAPGSLEHLYPEPKRRD